MAFWGVLWGCWGFFNWCLEGGDVGIFGYMCVLGSLGVFELLWGCLEGDVGGVSGLLGARWGCWGRFMGCLGVLGHFGI